jgi:hypothetical protein
MAQITLNSTGVASSGALVLQSNGTTTAVTVSTGQVATLVNDAVVNGLTVGRGGGAVATNTALGVSALSSNLTGSDTTAVGYRAYRFGTGVNNTAFGSNALGGAIVTGTENTAIGRAALLVHTTGNNNTAVGSLALLANTTGGNNIAVGVEALATNTTASGSTAVGYRALYLNTTGTNNIAMGQQALQANTTASNNTAVGYQAGYDTTTGVQNVAFGSQALYSVTTGNNNTAVGTKAGFTTTGGANVFMGIQSGYSLTTGSGNTFVGSNSASGVGYFMTTGSKNTILGGYNGNQGGLDIRTASNYIVLSDGDGNPRLFVDNSGFVNCAGAYSNTSAAAANATFNASGYFSRSTSALKYKQDIRDLESMDIGLLRPVRYKSKCEGDDQTKDHLGIVADEAADAGFEELVTRGADGEIEGFQYERLTVVLLKKLQVLESEFKAYKEAHP